MNGFVIFNLTCVLINIVNYHNGNTFAAIGAMIAGVAAGLCYDKTK